MPYNKNLSIYSTIIDSQSKPTNNLTSKDLALISSLNYIKIKLSKLI